MVSDRVRTKTKIFFVFYMCTGFHKQDLKSREIDIIVFDRRD